MKLLKTKHESDKWLVDYCSKFPNIMYSVARRITVIELDIKNETTHCVTVD